LQPRPASRTLEVVQRRLVTPNMLRISLGGPGLADFPAGKEGGYIKLVLPPAPGTKKPAVRTYTIRNQHEDRIDIDFVLHGITDGPAGPATDWAFSAKPGDRIEIGGPGPAKPLPPSADWYFLAGDMTALPAISVNLEQLDRNARGTAIIEIKHADDRQEIEHPAGVDIRWLVNPRSGEEDGMLVDELRLAGWPESQVYAWSACEFSSMRALRAYLLEERGLTRESLYISSYWKAGSSEDRHKELKRDDALIANR